MVMGQLERKVKECQSGLAQHHLRQLISEEKKSEKVITKGKLI